MPFDMIGSDQNGLAMPASVAKLANGARTVAAKVTHQDNSQVTYTAAVTVARPIPPLTGAEIRYSTKADLSGSALADGAVKTTNWWVFLNTSTGTANDDVAKVEWYLNGVLQTTDSTSPYGMYGNTAWVTTDSRSHTVTAKVFRNTSGTPVTLSVTVQSETAGPTPGAPLAWPRSTYKNAAFGVVRTPVRVFARNTYVVAGDKAKRNNNWSSGTKTQDIEIVLPTGAPLDAMGGIVAVGYRSVSVVGGEISVGRNWAQQWVDDNKGVGKFARGDGSYVSTRGGTPVNGATDEERKCMDFEATQRAFYFKNCDHVYIEGVAITGPALMEGFDIDGSRTGLSDVYIQNVDIRTQSKWRDGWAASGTIGASNHSGGDVLQVWAPTRLHVDDFRVQENWFQGIFLKNDYTSTGVATADFRHVVFKNVQGYDSGGGFAYWSNAQAFTSIDMTNEIYFKGDKIGSHPVIQATWPRDAKGNTVPQGGYFTSEGANPFVLPPSSQVFPAGAATFASVARVFGGTTGTPSLAVDANGDHYASSSGVLKLKAYDLHDKTPDYKTWPGGLNTDPVRAAAGQSTAGVGYR